MATITVEGQGNYGILFKEIVVYCEQKEANIYFWTDINPVFRRYSCAALRSELEEKNEDYWSVRPIDAGVRPAVPDHGDYGRSVVECTYGINKLRPDKYNVFLPEIQHPDKDMRLLLEDVTLMVERQHRMVASAASAMLVRLTTSNHNP